LSSSLVDYSSEQKIQLSVEQLDCFVIEDNQLVFAEKKEGGETKKKDSSENFLTMIRS